MQLTTRQRIAIANAGKFTRLDLAQHAAINQKYWVQVLRDQEGFYRVPATNREQSILEKLGYTVV